MYRRAMSTRLSRGRSTPAILATLSLLVPRLSLTLLVPRVGADHTDHATPADDLAPIAHPLHRRPDLHVPNSPTCTDTRSCRETGRTATVPPTPCPPGGSGCSASASC